MRRGLEASGLQCGDDMMDFWKNPSFNFFFFFFQISIL